MQNSCLIRFAGIAVSISLVMIWFHSASFCYSDVNSHVAVIHFIRWSFLLYVHSGGNMGCDMNS